MYCESLQCVDGNWMILAGLPSGWALLQWTLPNDISAADLTDRWRELVRFGAQLRIVRGSGLKVTRTRWMAGAGPTLRVNSEKRCNSIWIDHKEYDVNALGEIGPKGGVRVGPTGRTCCMASRHAKDGDYVSHS